MKVLYIHQYFKTPMEGGSIRSYSLARELVKKNHEVLMITTHNNSRRVAKEIEGLQVIYLPVRYGNEMSFGRRIIAFMKFMILAIIESVKHRNIDLCYVMTTPLSTGIIALFNKVFLGRPYVFEVGDLWPKVPIDLGLIQKRWQMQLLLLAERIFYRQAKGLIGLSDPISAHLQRISPNVPIETVYNISDCKRFKPAVKKAELVEKYKVDDQFVISYTGTFGMANDLSRLVDLAAQVQDLPIQFLIVGDGAERKKIEHLTEKRNLNNLVLYKAMDKTKILEIINITDAMFVSFADVESLHTGSPNKFFDALAAGKLIITNFNGWIGELIESNSCGVVVRSADDFRSEMSGFLHNPVKLSTYQGNARRLAESRFELGMQAETQLRFIQTVVSH
ncbi:MAG: glycosyltransferase family 4 protein [Reichenbachiella sp.]|uniref:glycosyltransferase family 4 protein n=1 Tax=Reichenbachiella sp. TaxID=2184521 RepID=UPI003267BF4D